LYLRTVFLSSELSKDFLPELFLGSSRKPQASPQTFNRRVDHAPLVDRLLQMVRPPEVSAALQLSLAEPNLAAKRSDFTLWWQIRAQSTNSSPTKQATLHRPDIRD